MTDRFDLSESDSAEELRTALRDLNSENKILRSKLKELTDSHPILPLVENLSHQQALVRLYQLLSKSQDSFYKSFTEITLQVLSVSRVSIWFLRNDGKELECITLFNRAELKHSSGMVINRTNVPSYFNALYQSVVLKCDCTFTSPHLIDLKDDYLIPYDIQALLDIPLFDNGDLLGVVCFEQQGSKREWLEYEIEFAEQAAQLVELVYLKEKDKQNQLLQNRFAHLLKTATRITSELLLIDDFRECINQVLYDLRMLTGSDGVGLFEPSADPNAPDVLYYTTSSTIADKTTEFLSTSYLSMFKLQSVIGNAFFEFTDQDAINAGEGLFTSPQKSVSASLMYRESSITGVIIFANKSQNKVWLVEEKEIVGIISRAIAGAIERENAFRKISESKDEADRANLSKSEFLANMSHEIRTPLNAILGFSELLLTKINDALLLGYLNAIHSSGKNLLSLINDILDMAKIEAGRFELKSNETDIRVLVGDTVKLFNDTAQQKNVQLKQEYHGDEQVNVVIDDIRFRQILFNIVGNAVKFTEAGYVNVIINISQITEKLSPVQLIIEVEDTGIGIPVEQQQIIFESFRQTTGSATRKYGGTGLGLALTKKLIERMNGELALKSIPGKGTLISIIFPEVPAVIKASAAAKQSLETFGESKKRVLIADDVKYNRVLLRLTLEKLKVEVFEAESGSEVLELVEQVKPHLLLIDIHLGDMDGFEVVEKLKKKDSTKNIPLLAFTASSLESDEVRIMQTFDDMIAKPVDRKNLIEKLSKYLSLPNLTDTKKEQSGKSKKEETISEGKNPELAVILETKLLVRWRELSEVPSLTDAEEFAKELETIALQFGNRYFAEVSKQLLQAVGKFDIGSIKNTLKDFDKRINELK